MTSPAQLKYLDAMGIPVWVSRDAIIEDTISLESRTTNNNKTDVLQDINQSPNQHSSNLAKSPAQKNNQSVQSAQSAQSILNSLEATATRSHIFAADKLSGETVGKAIDAAKLSDNINSNSSTAFEEVTNDENLLFQSSQHCVYAIGNKQADWMVIGHSPETYSAIGQEPFASEAGVLLDNMLRAVGIEQPRSHAYLLNVIDKNQDSDIDEKHAADNKLKLNQDLTEVIHQVKPLIILFVGQIAAQNLLGSNDPLIVMRSKVHSFGDTKIPCVVTYYPSYLLQKPTDKRKAWDDLKLAMNQLL